MGAFLQISFLALVLLGSSRPNWSVVSTGKNQFALQSREDKKIRHPIAPTPPGAPRYIGMTRTKKKGIVLLIYLSGSAGTSSILDIYRAVVFNTQNKKFYGDFPFRVQATEAGKSWPDTVFTFNKNSFTVEDSSTNLKKTINY